MDPVTHAVIGAAISKLSGNSVTVTDAATMAVIIGSVFPDADILMQKWGDYAYLKNHRGASHSIVGLGISAIFISAFLSWIYSDTGFLQLFLWSFAGCLAHSFFDLFNCYGAKLLWPFIKKRYSLKLLVVFDPIFFGTLAGYVFTAGKMQYYFLTVFCVYVFTRFLMRLFLIKQLRRRFRTSCKKISILPSMSGIFTGMFRWNFILENAACNIVGERNLLRRKAKIIKKLYKPDEEVLEKVMESHVGRFFKDFTPLFHVEAEQDEGVTRYIFTDMRYYMNDNFLHHAVLELDENDSVVKSSFNPYSMARSSEIKSSGMFETSEPLNA